MSLYSSKNGDFNPQTDSICTLHSLLLPAMLDEYPLLGTGKNGTILILLRSLWLIFVLYLQCKWH